MRNAAGEFPSEGASVSRKGQGIVEQGKVNYGRMTDLELCGLIDNQVLPNLFRNPEEASVYALPFSKRAKLYDILWQKYLAMRYQRKDSLFGGKTITEAQLARCLCMKYDSSR